MVHLKEALDGLGEPFLAILDELGAGTDPIEGSALGEATLLHFHARRGFTLCSTHHEPLKARALATEGMGNASMSSRKVTFGHLPPGKWGPWGPAGRWRSPSVPGCQPAFWKRRGNSSPRRRGGSKMSWRPWKVKSPPTSEKSRRSGWPRLERMARARPYPRNGMVFLREKAEWFAAALPERLRRWEEDFLSGLKAEVNLQSVKRRARKETVRLVENAREELEIPARAAAGLTSPPWGIA